MLKKTQTVTQPDSPSNATLAAAATWYVDLQNVDHDHPLHQQHQLWLGQDLSHKKAWRRVEKLQQGIAQLPNSINAHALLNGRHSRREAIKALTALMMVTGMLGGVAWQQQDQLKSRGAHHKTSTGEQRKLTLADGSRVQLNTNTDIDVNFTDQVRAIYLHLGEIQITTAKDSLNRDFIVYCRQGSIQALGTTFIVRSDHNFSQVSVISHAVKLQTRDNVNDAVIVNRSQQLRFSRSALSTVIALPEHANAWTRGLLVVDDWSLKQFTEELSRYYVGKISCASSVEKLRISGTFHLHDIKAILENLSHTLPITLYSFSRYWLRISEK